MDEFFFLAMIVILALLAIPICIIILFFRTGTQTDRIQRLEREVSRQAQAMTALVGGAMLQPEPAVRADLAEAVPPEFAEPEPDLLAEADQTPADVMAEADIPAAEAPASSAWDRAVGGRAAAEDAPAMRVTGETVAANRAERVSAGEPIPDILGRLIGWLQANWIYAISAASLGLAGIFFVQYGMERGLLPPALRVVMGILFGLCLIAAGEWLRRRHGDEGDTTTQYLPSVFAGAGIVSVFAATLAARHMYGLIGPEMAFALHLCTAALAVALGWFYGPLMAAVGLIGAAASPFIVAGGSDAAPWLYAYFALIAAVGLGIDAVRQWRWVAVLALVLGYAGSFMVMAGGAGMEGFVIVQLVLAAMAVVIPPLALTPQHAGPFMLQAVLGQSGKVVPEFAVRLAFGAAVASTVFLFISGLDANNHLLLAPLGLTVLALGYLIWGAKAEGLTDLAVLPAIGLLAWIALEGLFGGPVVSALVSLPLSETGAILPLPNSVTWLVLMAVTISAVAAWRALQAQQDWLVDMMFGLMAVLTVSVAVAALELLWAPARFIGEIAWAAHIIGAAALMTGLATRFAAADQGDMRRAAHAILAALSLIALAMFLLTTATALTLALAVLLVAAAVLDRRFNLPEMGLFQQVGTAVLSWRLMFDPGLEFALEGPLGSVCLAFAGSIAAFAAARWMAHDRPRPITLAVLESAGAALAAVFASVLIVRLVLPDVWFPIFGHWQASMMAMPWLVLMGVQVYRAEVSGWLKRARQGLALVAGVIAASWLLAAVVPFNPLGAYGPDDVQALVKGPWILNSLFIAYALPGLFLLGMRPFMPALLRLPFLCIGAALVALYGVLEIRHWFQGAWLGAPGVAQGELYTYTLALMIIGASLLIQSIRKGSPLLRRVAMAVIGITIAKVFFIDAAGLTGLTRVFSFLGLGLSLAGLAWLNRWAERASRAE